MHFISQFSSFAPLENNKNLWTPKVWLQSGTIHYIMIIAILLRTIDYKNV